MRILKRLVLGFGCVVAVSAVQFSFNIFSIRNLGRKLFGLRQFRLRKWMRRRTVSEKFSAANAELNEY